MAASFDNRVIAPTNVMYRSASESAAAREHHASALNPRSCDALQHRKGAENLFCSALHGARRACLTTTFFFRIFVDRIYTSKRAKSKTTTTKTVLFPHRETGNPRNCNQFRVPPLPVGNPQTFWAALPAQETSWPAALRWHCQVPDSGTNYLKKRYIS